LADQDLGNKKSPKPHLDDNDARDDDADDLMKLAREKCEAAKKLGGGMTLDQALSAAMKERPDLLKRSMHKSLAKAYGAMGWR
jgi:hypothetical protein